MHVCAFLCFYKNCFISTPLVEPGKPPLNTYLLVIGSSSGSSNISSKIVIVIVFLFMSSVFRCHLFFRWSICPLISAPVIKAPVASSTHPPLLLLSVGWNPAAMSLPAPPIHPSLPLRIPSCISDSEAGGKSIDSLCARSTLQIVERRSRCFEQTSLVVSEWTESGHWMDVGWTSSMTQMAENSQEVGFEKAGG